MDERQSNRNKYGNTDDGSINNTPVENSDRMKANIDKYVGEYEHYLDDYSDDDATAEMPKATASPTEFEDISSDSNGDHLKKNAKAKHNPKNNKSADNSATKEPFFKRNKYKNLKITILCVVLAIILAFGSVFAYIYFSTKGADYNDNGVDIHKGDYSDDTEDLNFASMGDVTDADSLNALIYEWATNKGELMYSKNVINVLLCGVDSESGKSVGRSDTIILVSIDKKNKKITMTSLLRDCYTFMSIPTSSGGTKDMYMKINAAYSLGGPTTLEQTIENDFKIRIDEYVAVDFTSFPKLIDAVGGVTVDVTEKEGKFIRRTSSQTSFPYGKDVELNGKQALIYSRIRHLDTDVNRAERQRKVVKALIESMKTATKGQLLNAYKQTADYFRTGYSHSDVMSLIAQAYVGGWMKYDINELTFPSEDNIDRASAYVDTTTDRNQWVWIVDYPYCAQKMQKAIYGTSNVVLSSNRKTALDMMNISKKSSSSSSSSGSSSSSSTTHSYSSTTKYKSYTSKYSSTSSSSKKSTTAKSTTAVKTTAEKTTTDNNNKLDSSADSNSDE